MRNIVNHFYVEFQEFFYDIEHRIEQSMKKQQLGETDGIETLPELIKIYRSSKFEISRTNPYIEHLSNQINLLETFFILTESLRFLQLLLSQLNLFTYLLRHSFY